MVWPGNITLMNNYHLISSLQLTRSCQSTSLKAREQFNAYLGFPFIIINWRNIRMKINLFYVLRGGNLRTYQSLLLYIAYNLWTGYRVSSLLLPNPHVRTNIWGNKRPMSYEPKLSQQKYLETNMIRLMQGSPNMVSICSLPLTASMPLKAQTHEHESTPLVSYTNANSEPRCSHSPSSQSHKQANRN